MFTVCPKCALTLVVTAADLRVAQGYVRCGRCSNVFNALARLSEDRQAAAQPASQSGARDTGASARLRTSPGSGATTSRTRALQEPANSPGTTDSPKRDARQPPPAAGKAATKTVSPRAASPQRADEDSIPDDALEFNAEATDVSKVFVEQPPTPEFRAATGTFRALRHEAEESARAAGHDHAAGDEATPAEHDERAGVQFDIELDSELLAEITGNRLTRLDSTAAARPASDVSTPERADAHGAEGDADSPDLHIAKLLTEEIPPAEVPEEWSAHGRVAAEPPGPEPAAAHAAPPLSSGPREAPREGPREAPSAAMTRSSTAFRAAPAQDNVPPPKPAAAVASGRTAVPVTNTARAAPAKRASPLETAEAIRNALSPRKKASPAQASTDSAPPTDPMVLGWTIGTVLMGLLLAGQVVNHFRNDLAASAQLHGPLTSVYAALGITLIPKWNLSSYEVRQLGATTDAESAGHITVRASVKNGAHQSKPLPFLRVTLQDRFGNRIASRDVPPQSYLPRAIPVSTLLAPGQRIDAEMVFVDPGTNAVGFEIDACLPAPGGGITCANDVTSR
ncbi:MAG: DUF3426 domain-containing protein [Sinobacteraceae bacterium]|nr:DUF3426 domain-containing protein [Nevskiaceae bacterium]